MEREMKKSNNMKERIKVGRRWKRRQNIKAKIAREKIK
jgi:hypothetical protein